MGTRFVLYADNPLAFVPLRARVLLWIYAAWGQGRMALKDDGEALNFFDLGFGFCRHKAFPEAWLSQLCRDQDRVDHRQWFAFQSLPMLFQQYCVWFLSIFLSSLSPGSFSHPPSSSPLVSLSQLLSFSVSLSHSLSLFLSLSLSFSLFLSLSLSLSSSSFLSFSWSACDPYHITGLLSQVCK